MTEQPRKIEILVLSDIHLGTYGCHARELHRYMKSVEPGTVILNGDIIDIWQFSKRYWPKAHMKVLKKIVKWMSAGIPVYYVTGNHDEMLRKFSDLQMGALTLTDQLLMDIDGKKTWIFHGDVFDISMKHSRWLARLGGKSYDYLILLNRLVNHISRIMGSGPVSLSKKVKDSVKKAVKFISDYEDTAADVAITRGYDVVVCGHIHQPQQRVVEKNHRKVLYLNSGDWIENLTALEYNSGKWSIYEYRNDPRMTKNEVPEENPEENTTHIRELLSEVFQQPPAAVHFRLNSL